MRAGVASFEVMAVRGEINWVSCTSYDERACFGGTRELQPLSPVLDGANKLAVTFLGEVRELYQRIISFYSPA